MKPIFLFISFVFFTLFGHGQDCYKRSAISINTSYGVHKNGFVISFETGSWGIERRTAFYAGLLMYYETQSETKNGETTSYKMAVADPYFKLGFKLNYDDGNFDEGRLQTFHVISALASIRGNIGISYTAYAQIGYGILAGIEPSWQSKNGLGISARVAFSLLSR